MFSPYAKRSSKTVAGRHLCLSTRLQYFALSKFKAFADDNFNVAKILQSVTDRAENIVGKAENAALQNQHFLLFPQFLAPLAVGQWAYVMAHCPLCVCLSVCACMCVCVRLCVNFFFKHLLLWNYWLDFDEISQKCSYHGLLQNFLKEFDSLKNSGCHGNKT